MRLRYLTLCNDFFNKELPYTDEELLSMGVRLRHESAYITDYIKRGANEEFKFDCVRINLVCTLPPISDKIRKFESVHEIDVPFDVDYFSMTPDQKEQYLIDVAEIGLTRFCSAAEWEFSVFQKHINALRSREGHIEFYIPDKKCRKEKLSAKVFCVHTMTEAIYFMDFFYSRKLIQRKLFAVSLPTTMTYRSNIYRMEWSDERTVSVYTYTDELYAQVTLDVEIPDQKSSDKIMDCCTEQVERVYRVKSLCAQNIGRAADDLYIDFWEENKNGQIFLMLSLPKQGYHMFLTLVTPSGDVICGYNDNYESRNIVIKDFKHRNGWIYD